MQNMISAPYMCSMMKMLAQNPDFGECATLHREPLASGAALPAAPSLPAAATESRVALQSDQSPSLAGIAAHPAGTSDLAN